MSTCDSGPKNHDSQRRDKILRFLLRAIFSTFWATSLLNYTENLEKDEQKSTAENSKKKSSGDGAPKLQILSLVVVERGLSDNTLAGRAAQRVTRTVTLPSAGGIVPLAMDWAASPENL